MDAQGPDREEVRLFLDPNNRDTDQDGISDAKDPVPNVAAGHASELTDIYSAALAFIIAYRGWEDGLNVISGDRKALRGLTAPMRTIVLSPEELEVYRKTYGDPGEITLDIRYNGNNCTVKRSTGHSELALAGKRHRLRGWQFTVTNDVIE